MSKLEDKIIALENLVEEREKRLKGKIRNTVIAYAVAVIVVAGYTSFIVPKIQEMTSPENVVEIAKGWAAQQTTDLRNRAIEQLRSHSDDWARTIVSEGMNYIPQLEKPIMMVFDDLTDYIVQHVEQELIPSFTGALKENAAELKERYSEFRDDEKMQGLSLIFVEVFETEMDQYINDKFVKEVNELQKRLRALDTSGTELTKKQDAQRRLLINWLYLTERGDTGDSAFGKGLDVITQLFRDVVEIAPGDDEFEDEKAEEDDFTDIHAPEEM